jgi:hypothetical protein
MAHDLALILQYNYNYYHTNTPDFLYGLACACRSPLGDVLAAAEHLTELGARQVEHLCVCMGRIGTRVRVCMGRLTRVHGVRVRE